MYNSKISFTSLIIVTLIMDFDVWCFENIVNMSIECFDQGLLGTKKYLKIDFWAYTPFLWYKIQTNIQLIKKTYLCGLKGFVLFDIELFELFVTSSTLPCLIGSVQIHWDASRCLPVRSIFSEYSMNLVWMWILSTGWNWMNRQNVFWQKNLLYANTVYECTYVCVPKVNEMWKAFELHNNSFYSAHFISFHLEEKDERWFGIGVWSSFVMRWHFDEFCALNSVRYFFPIFGFVYFQFSQVRTFSTSATKIKQKQTPNKMKTNVTAPQHPVIVVAVVVVVVVPRTLTIHFQKWFAPFLCSYISI